MRYTRILCLLLGLSGAAYGSDTEAFARVFGPKTTMLLARPTLRWEIWAGKGGAVTSQTMTINGRQVKSRYDLKQRAVIFTPAEPFPPGEYKVQCRVVIDDSLVANKEWKFSVAPNASASLPPPDADQQRAFAGANSYRAALGLPPFQRDDQLNAAALAHSRYLALNNTTGHFQKPGRPGFVGEQPGDRLEAFGFVDESWEDVSYGSPTPEASVQNLFEAPYHRIPFMQPGPVLLGTGFAERRLTMEFGGSKAEGVVVSPAAGQANVPTSWDGNERPNPLRLHDASGIVGYVVVFSFWGSEQYRLDVQEAQDGPGHALRQEAVAPDPCGPVCAGCHGPPPGVVERVRRPGFPARRRRRYEVCGSRAATGSSR